MDVAVKVLLFQSEPLAASVMVDRRRNCAVKVCNRNTVLREAAMCCCMCHPNVVATYNYKVRP